MKKVSIIILLTALILGAFTACNGDVFSDLMPNDDPEPTPKRTITLEIPEDLMYITFNNTSDIKTKNFEIPDDCNTWAEFLTVVTGIKVFDVEPPTPLEYTLHILGNEVYFGEYDYGLELDNSKVAAPDTELTPVCWSKSNTGVLFCLESQKNRNRNSTNSTRKGLDP